MRPRRRRRGAAGFTLVDAILSIALMSVAVLVLVYSFAQAEKMAGLSVRSAGMEALMRQAADTLRSPAGYTYCASTTSYRWQLPAVPAGQSIAITAVAPVTGSASGGAPLPAVEDCSTGTVIYNTCPAGHLCDYGVQRLTIVISAPGSNLSRVIFKGANS